MRERTRDALHETPINGLNVITVQKGNRTYKLVPSNNGYLWKRGDKTLRWLPRNLVEIVLKLKGDWENPNVVTIPSNLDWHSERLTFETDNNALREVH